MTSSQSKFSLLLFALLMVTTHAASASYKDSIQDRTDRNNGVSGKWFRLKAADWVFYEGEASAQYNMGAIAQGTNVEVLKWNRFMARVRLPDGRVVFIRNRLLTEASKPSTSEIKSQAEFTAAIGRDKLHGGDPYVHATRADVSGRTQIDSALNAGKIPIPQFRADVVKDQKTWNTTNTVTGEIKPAAEIKPAVEVKPATEIKAAVKPTDVKADQPVDRNGRPVRVIGFTDPQPTQNDGVQLNQSDAKAQVDANQHPSASLESSKAVNNVPVPAERPLDQGKPTVTLYNGQKCDPTAKWQSPIREKYRIRDCIASARGRDRKHAGIDMAGASPGMQGIPVFPSAPGKVIFAGFRGGYGCLVIVQHDSCPKETSGAFASQGRCQTRYAHMATRTIKKKNGRKVKVCDVPTEGDMVNTCDRIGRMSGTGKRASANDYASHLHFEMRSESESTAFNPLITVAAIKNNPNYNAEGSVACNSVKNSVGFSSIGLSNGDADVTVRQAAEGVD